MLKSILILGFVSLSIGFSAHAADCNTNTADFKEFSQTGCRGLRAMQNDLYCTACTILDQNYDDDTDAGVLIGRTIVARQNPALHLNTLCDVVNEKHKIRNTWMYSFTMNVENIMTYKTPTTRTVHAYCEAKQAITEGAHPYTMYWNSPAMDGSTISPNWKAACKEIKTVGAHHFCSLQSESRSTTTHPAVTSPPTAD